jgi:hypothetical protein
MGKPPTLGSGENVKVPVGLIVPENEDAGLSLRSLDSDVVD